LENCEESSSSKSSNSRVRCQKRKRVKMIVSGYGARKKWNSFKQQAWTSNNATQTTTKSIQRHRSPRWQEQPHKMLRDPYKIPSWQGQWKNNKTERYLSWEGVAKCRHEREQLSSRERCVFEGDKERVETLSYKVYWFAVSLDSMQIGLQLSWKELACSALWISQKK